MKEWQFNVLFFVGVGGAILMLIGPSIGMDLGQNPTALTGVGAILTYILTQRKALRNNGDAEKEEEKPNVREGENDVERPS